MKTFLIKTILFSSVLFGSLYLIAFFADGNTDQTYLKLTTKKQTSLIIGTSKAAQGIIPKILNTQLNRSDVYNYAFALSISPYGSIYYEAIKEKLDTNTKNGIFIVTVDSWSLASHKESPNDSLTFDETKSAFVGLNNFNQYPNFSYLTHAYNQQFIYLFVNKLKNKNMKVENDGWLNIDIPMDNESIKKRTQNKTKDFRDVMLPTYKFSEVRFNYLKKTITLLKNHGKVYLVKLPVSAEMLKVDDLLISDFEQKMNSLCLEYQISYLNLNKSSQSYELTDGNHLSKKGAEKASLDIAKWIINK